ncbi:hypothetical protein DPMN_082851 [Dreissena polymorpha]|uniref:Uncharacterized protein n=1 Tax=Dreissena polymorpha TaxID=45954 RepID=A0A9D4BHP5_DREPO|nr:hypothetical protein DPMN_082851 [Dreissena polymorpha]
MLTLAILEDMYQNGSTINGPNRHRRSQQRDGTYVQYSGGQWQEEATRLHCTH